MDDIAERFSEAVQTGTTKEFFIDQGANIPHIDEAEIIAILKIVCKCSDFFSTEICPIIEST
jgi:hypothetical protein